MQILAFAVLFFFIMSLITHPGMRFNMNNGWPMKKKNKLVGLLILSLVVIYVFVSFFPSVQCPAKYEDKLTSERKRAIISLTLPSETKDLRLRTGIKIIRLDTHNVYFEAKYFPGGSAMFRYSDGDGLDFHRIQDPSSVY